MQTIKIKTCALVLLDAGAVCVVLIGPLTAAAVVIPADDDASIGRTVVGTYATAAAAPAVAVVVIVVVLFVLADTESIS